MERLGILDEWLEATAETASPEVRFSSCFPFYGDTLYVVPPQHVWPPPPSAKVRWKGAKFVPVKVVETLLAGESLNEESWIVEVSSQCLMPSSTPSGAVVFRTSVRSGAAVDRAGDGVAPHSAACLEFAPGAGLWFAVSFAGEEARDRWKERVAGAIRLLADSGIGGGRSRGWGRSEMPEIAEGPLPGLLLRSAGPQSSGHQAEQAYWLLSPFYPSLADTVDWQRGNYSLMTRTGRVESTAGWGIAKKATRMVAEGSVLVASSELIGSAPDVAPDGFEHPVYRAGFAVAVAVPLKPVAQASPAPVTRPGPQLTPEAAASPDVQEGESDEV
jgi:CRISPR type III-A-associated RAMP protein Csm4